MRKLVPVHPGIALSEFYLSPLEMSAGSLAKILKVPRTRIERIVAGDTGISTDTALRLAHYFDTTPELWTNMQATYDLHICRKSLAEELHSIPKRDAA